jgi:glycosyltransferase involved in cell wall biosynthesis
MSIDGPMGPAVARTRGAAIATGDLLVFVDTDVVVHTDALARLAALFTADEDLGAAFGAYDENPPDPGFFSQCRNLAHSFIHQRSDRDASTFWAGLGAIRADVFETVGGFDQRFAQPSVEDIDLGYRIRRAGFRIVLEPAARGTHLKRWTFWSSVVTDIRDRGVPWTQLLNRYRAMRNDLNVTRKYRFAVLMAYALVCCLAGAVVWPLLLLPALGLIAGFWPIDRPYYQFFARRRGLGFALRGFPFICCLCNGVSFSSGRCCTSASGGLASRFLDAAADAVAARGDPDALKPGGRGVSRFGHAARLRPLHRRTAASDTSVASTTPTPRRRRPPPSAVDVRAARSTDR